MCKNWKKQMLLMLLILIVMLTMSSALADLSNAGQSDDAESAVSYDGSAWLGEYGDVRVSRNKDETYYILEQPADITLDCGPDATETVNFRVNSDRAEYVWYLDVGDGNGFKTALEQADSGKAALGGWDDPEFSVNALITSAKAYCVATVESETFTSNTVTITLVHDFTEYTSTGDVNKHDAYCQRCFEKYPQEHMRRYQILSEATQYVAGSYRFDCVQCGYASASYGFGLDKVQDGAKLILDWNDGLGTQTEVEVTQFMLADVTETPVREGHIFLGWAVNPNAAEPDYIGDEVSVSIVEPVTTLYAVWKPYDYTIGGWVISDGTAENPITVKIDLYKLGADEVTGEATETFVQTIEVVCDDIQMAEAFTFEMLWPGDYRIKATAEGCTEFVSDVSVTEDYVPLTQHILIDRLPPLDRIDFTVNNIAAGKLCEGITAESTTPGVTVKEGYGAQGCKLYTEREMGLIGKPLTSGRIEGGQFYWVRVDYSLAKGYAINLSGCQHMMNGTIVSYNYEPLEDRHVYFHVYVPMNGAEATGSLDVLYFAQPEAFGYADMYDFAELDTNMACSIVELKWMKDDERFSGMFEHGETYTFCVEVRMDDNIAFPDHMYVTFAGETPTSVKVDGNLLIVTKDYKMDSQVTFKLPAELTTIKAEAFEGSIAEAFDIPAGCTSVGSRAFANCPNLKVLIIRSSSISIADDALAGNFEETGACRVTIISPADSNLPSWCKQHGVNWQPLN